MATNQLMTSRDRNELRRILRARFELLNRQLSVREQEIRAEIAEVIREEHKQAVKAGKKKIAKLQEKAAKLEAEGKALQDELEDAGVGPSGTSRRNGGYYGHYNILDVSVNDNLEPIDLQTKIQDAYSKLIAQAGLHKLDLGLQQLELEEELAIGALGSEEAKSFLGKIPSLETLLPKSTDVKAAISAAAEDIVLEEDGTKLK